MALSDSIGDFLTRIRNAQSARHRITKVLFSKINSSMLEILKNEGYILDYYKEEKEEKEKVDKTPFFIVKLKYHDNLPVISDIVRV